MRFLSKLVAASGLTMTLVAGAFALSTTAASASVRDAFPNQNFTNCHTTSFETWGPLQTRDHLTGKSDRDGWTKHNEQNCTDPCGDTWKGDGSQWQVTAYFDNDGGRNVCCDKHSQPGWDPQPVSYPQPVAWYPPPQPCQHGTSGNFFSNYCTPCDPKPVTKPCPPKDNGGGGSGGSWNGGQPGPHQTRTPPVV